MSVASKHSCASSTHTSCQPRSRTHNASLCSTPNAPGSSRARLPIIATTGSVPVISFSSCFASRRPVVSWVVIAPPLLSLRPGVDVEEVVVVYPPTRYLLFPPLVVAIFVLFPHREDIFVALLDKFEVVDHYYAVLDRAHVGADATSGTVAVVDRVQLFRGDLEALVGAVDPALSALDARVEIDNRPHGPVRGSLVVRVALTQLDSLDDDGLAHLAPPRQLDRFVVVLCALARLDLVGFDLVVAVLESGEILLAESALAHHGLYLTVLEDVGARARYGAEHPHVRAVVAVDPEPAQARRPRQDGQRPIPGLLRDDLQKLFGCPVRDYQQRPAAPETHVDRLPPVPGPGLDPVAHRVVKDRDHVQLVGLVFGHVLLERYVIRSDDRELLGRNAVALRRITVALDRRS